jgi:hypothetical protein
MLFQDQPSFVKKASSVIAFLLVSSPFSNDRPVAQDFPKPSASSEQSASSATLPVIKTESRIALVDAVVTDKKGNYLHNLTQQDFRAYENNKEQKIVSLSFGSEALAEAYVPKDISARQI